MIGSTRQVSVWAYGTAADLRKGFDGLSGLVSQGLGRDPLSGDCYLFVNATRKRAKVLLWDGTGPLHLRQAARARALRVSVARGRRARRTAHDERAAVVPRRQYARRARRAVARAVRARRRAETSCSWCATMM